MAHFGCCVCGDADRVGSEQSHHLLGREPYRCKLGHLCGRVYARHVWHPVEICIRYDSVPALLADIESVRIDNCRHMQHWLHI